MRRPRSHVTAAGSGGRRLRVAELRSGGPTTSDLKKLSPDELRAFEREVDRRLRQMTLREKLAPVLRHWADQWRSWQDRARSLVAPSSARRAPRARTRRTARRARSPGRPSGGDDPRPNPELAALDAAEAAT